MIYITLEKQLVARLLIWLYIGINNGMLRVTRNHCGGYRVTSLCMTIDIDTSADTLCFAVRNAEQAAIITGEDLEDMRLMKPAREIVRQLKEKYTPLLLPV